MWSLAYAAMPAVSRATTHAAAAAPPPHLDVIALFGFLSALVTLGCLPHLRASRAMKVIFAASLAANAAYAFLSGAWPLGVVGVVVTGMAAHACWTGRSFQLGASTTPPLRRVEHLDATVYESRGLGLFGPSFDGRHASENN